VPGAVQLDWAEAQGRAWTEGVHWTYRATLPSLPHAAGERIVFACGGVDYRFDVPLEQEGMFTPARRRWPHRIRTLRR
jgi:hypothetical protein